MVMCFIYGLFQAEPEGFADYHLYVCAAFLTKFSKDLKKEHDFQVRPDMIIPIIITIMPAMICFA